MLISGDVTTEGMRGRRFHTTAGLSGKTSDDTAEFSCGDDGNKNCFVVPRLVRITGLALAEAS